MIWLFAACAAYAALGVALTRRMCAPTLKIHINDQLTGGMFMPVIAILSTLCVALRRFWRGLLIILDFEPKD